MDNSSMLLNACAGGGRFAGPAELTAAQYARVSTQAHVVLSLGVLASTLAFGSHALLVVGAHSDDAEKAWIAGIVDRYPRVCRMQAPHAPYTASGCSLLLSGLYLLLRVLALCNSCVTSGFVWRDVVQRQHLAISASLLCAGSVELLHGVALRQEAQPGGDSSGSMAARLRKRCAAFGSEWTHDIWFIHVMATALIFLGHPQAGLTQWWWRRRVSSVQQHANQRERDNPAAWYQLQGVSWLPPYRWRHTMRKWSEVILHLTWATRWNAT
jgi:hypothetical protein